MKLSFDSNVSFQSDFYYDIESRQAADGFRYYLKTKVPVRGSIRLGSFGLLS
jgi:hypothetical protein